MKVFRRPILLVCALGMLHFQSCSSSPVSNRDTAAYRLEISNSLIKNGNYPEALRLLLQAEKEDSANPYIQSNLGLVYFFRERYELSEKHYLEAIRLKPDFTDAKNSLARMYLETNRLTKAEKYLKEAIEDLTYPTYQKTYANYGILEFKKENYKESVHYLKKSLERDRDNCVTHTYLGRAMTELKDFSSAIAQFDKAMSFCTQIDSDEAHYHSAIALFRSQQPSLAVDRFELLLKVFPEGKNADKARHMIALIRRGTAQ